MQTSTNLHCRLGWSRLSGLRSILKTAPSSMRLSSSELEMTRPFADPHPGQVLSDVVLPRRVTFSQSKHSKNLGSSLRPMLLPSDRASFFFCITPLSRATLYTRAATTTSGRIKRGMPLHRALKTRTPSCDPRLVPLQQV